MRSLLKNGLTSDGLGIGPDLAAHTDQSYRALNKEYGSSTSNFYSHRNIKRWAADTTAKWAPEQPRNATAVVNELDVLLTGGRLGAFNKDVIETEFRKTLNHGKCDSYFVSESFSIRVLLRSHASYTRMY